MNKNIFFIKKINKLLFTRNLLDIKKFYILSISGGQDSISLLFLFYIIKKQLQIKISILYCNHLWQKDNFRQSVQLRQVCFLFRIDFFQIIPNNFLLTENKGRIWRLKNFNRFCFFFKTTFIVTGHSSTDRIETFFLNLIRGANINGLKSFNEKKTFFFNQLFFVKNNFFIFNNKKICFLKNKNKIRKPKEILNKLFVIEYNKFKNYYILRPFFLSSRNELKNFATLLQLPIYPDKTNLNYIYKRNRLRQQLFPLLKKFFNKQVDINIIKLINFFSITHQELLNEYNQLYKYIFIKQKNIFSINMNLFNKLSIEKRNQFLFTFFSTNFNYSIDIIFLTNFISYIMQKKVKRKIFLIPKIGLIRIDKNYLYIITL